MKKQVKKPTRTYYLKQIEEYKALLAKAELVLEQFDIMNIQHKLFYLEDQKDVFYYIAGFDTTNKRYRYYHITSKQDRLSIEVQYLEVLEWFLDRRGEMIVISKTDRRYTALSAMIHTYMPMFKGVGIHLAD